MGCTARLMMLFAAGLLLLSYLSVLVNPAHAWWVTIFGLLFIPLLLLNAFLVVWSIFRRSRAIWIPLVALLPSFLIIGSYWQFSGKPDTGEGIKIVSYNVGRFAFAQGKEGFPSEKSVADSVAGFLMAQDADIICLQEFHYSDPAKISSYIRKMFPGYYYEYFVYPDPKGCYGNVTLSRKPIEGRGKMDFEKSSNLAIFSDIDIAGKLVRVYNCHFQSYNISLTHLAKTLSREERKDAFRETESKMRASIRRRPKQVDMVMNDIASCPLETIVAGDFNDTPLSYTYRKLRRGHKDTFIEAGTHSGATFYAFRPFLRIDYLLCPKSCDVLSHDIEYKKYSDHFPIIARFK